MAFMRCSFTQHPCEGCLDGVVIHLSSKACAVAARRGKKVAEILGRRETEAREPA